MGSSQQFSLRWNNYLHHITSAFDSLRSDSDLVDVTLSCEGKKIKAHKMLLSACSTYFKDLFKENPCQHPVIVFRNVNFADLEALIDFMYQGEVNVIQEQLASFLTTAELLEVQGLTDGAGKDLTEGLDESNIDASAGPAAESNTPTEQKRSNSTNDAYFASPNQNPVSPPTKRKKWSAPSTSTNSQRLRSEKNNANSAGNILDIIPVVSQVKVEMPDFVDTDGGRISFNTTDGESPIEVMSGIEHSLPSTSGGNKEESLDIYGGNSSDAGEITGEPPDLSQVLAKAGPSTEGSQDSLQGGAPLAKEGLWTRPETSESQQFGFTCEICGKNFKHRNSRYNHMPTHYGVTECPVCHIVLGQRSNMKRHLRHVHSIFVNRDLRMTELSGNGKK